MDIGKEALGKLGVIDVAHNNIQISILGVMRIVDLAALDQFKLMPEIADIARLGVDDRRRRIQLIQQRRQRNGGLLRFDQLPCNKVR